jgi:hypothetical protein
MPETPTGSEDKPTSAVMHELIKQVPDGFFTLEWLVNCLPNRSFGVLFLFLAVIAVLPVISIPARILILVLTFQAIVGYKAPALPRKWMVRPLPSQRLKNLERHVIPWLERLETVVKPRYFYYLTSLRRLAAFVAFLLTVLSLLAPFPLANVPPALISIMMALAYIGHDGLLFLAAFILATIMTVSIIFAVVAV